MAEYLTNTEELTAIADAIRANMASGYTINEIAEYNTISGSLYGRNASYIVSRAFLSCSMITTVSFPMVASIGSYAFSGCGSLTEISFPIATNIGSYAFANCSKLTNVDFPMTTIVNQYAFYNCSMITTVSFPIATNIGSYAFSNCSKLTNVDFPMTTIVNQYAFYNCSMITTVSFPMVASIGSYVFRSCRNLLSLYLNNISIVPPLGNNVFMSTPIGGYTASTGGVYGSVFVPASLYSSFLTATNWSSISARIVSV